MLAWFIGKLAKIQSLVYPLYDSQGFLLAGPIIRMRVGNLISADNGIGLPRIFDEFRFFIRQFNMGL
jgi:hypothetical protein